MRPRTRGESCPSCARPLAGVGDYPLVTLLGVRRLPPPRPRSIGRAETAEEGDRRRLLERLAWVSPATRDDVVRVSRASPHLRAWLAALRARVGGALLAAELAPQLPAHSTFPWAWRLPETPYALAFRELPASREGARVADLTVCAKGPSLGSAGGPTLMEVFAFARLRYVGRLLDR